MAGETYPRFDLSGLCVLVTGASRGIGRAIALACAHAGADMALGLRHPASGGEVAAEIERLRRRAVPVKLDVTDLAEIESGVAAAHTAFGKIDVLVNNVGLGPENLAENVTERDFDLTVAVNLKGTFFVSQAVGRLMIGRQFGRIVNLSSQAGRIAQAGDSIYCMTKAGIDQLTRSLALEWARYNITVNAVAPTWIWTDATRPALSDPAFLQRTLAHIPLGRIGEPEDVTGAVVFLASPAASLITGTSLLVDGGWTTG